VINRRGGTTSASGVVFSSGGMLQVDSGGHLSGTISGFHLGDEIDLRGLAYNSSSSTVSWTQRTSGANAIGTLTVKEGTQTQSFTLVGSYTTSNFSATSDGHGGTLVTDPPVVSGGSVVTNTEISSGGGSIPDIASTPSTDLGLQWLENMVESVVSDRLKTTGGFQQLLNEIEGWGSPGSGLVPLGPSDHSNFQVISGRRDPERRGLAGIRRCRECVASHLWSNLTSGLATRLWAHVLYSGNTSALPRLLASPWIGRCFRHA
jgi:hypothetical protein